MLEKGGKTGVMTKKSWLRPDDSSAKEGKSGIIERRVLLIWVKDREEFPRYRVEN